MNLTDANRIHDDAPDDCFQSMQDNDFRGIMELTREEKRELIALWRSYVSNKGRTASHNQAVRT